MVIGKHPIKKQIFSKTINKRSYTITRNNNERLDQIKTTNPI